MLCPAHSATWAASPDVRSQVDMAAWRRLYGMASTGDAASAGVKAFFLASWNTLR